jgi:hypothetical protein
MKGFPMFLVFGIVLLGSLAILDLLLPGVRTRLYHWRRRLERRTDPPDPLPRTLQRVEGTIALLCALVLSYLLISGQRP